MIWQDMIVVVSVVICLLMGVVLRIRKVEAKKLWGIYFLPALISLLHFLIFKRNLFLFIAYVGAIFMIGLYCIRKTKIGYGILASLILLSNLFLIIFPIKMQSKDYASLGYEQAFTKLHKQIEKEYALVDYKEIDLTELYEEYEPQMKHADQTKNATEYLQALQNYVEEFHDGHVNVYDMLEFFGVGSFNQLTQAKSEMFPNYYGLSLIKIDSGEYIAVNVEKDGNAYKSGIREGFIVTKWNGKDVDEQIEQIDHIPPVNTWMFADEENKERYLPFYFSCMGGTQASISYIDSNNQENIEVNLQSMGNGYDYLYETIGKFNHKANIAETAVTVKDSISYTIENSICVLTIDGFMGTKEENEERMDEICEQIRRQNVKRIVIDMRNNCGGDDEMAAVIMGYFTNEDLFYLEENTYNQKTKEYTKKRTIQVKGNGQIELPVKLLVNAQCISAGEGFVYNMAKLEKVQVVGMTGTNGSFGTFKGIQIMPENVMVVFPSIVCLDEDGNVMIDSSKDGIGGIKVDHQIPLDAKAAQQIFSENKDYEMKYLMQME